MHHKLQEKDKQLEDLRKEKEQVKASLAEWQNKYAEKMSEIAQL